MSELLRTADTKTRIRILAEDALAKLADQESRGQISSPLGATALVFLAEGREFLLAPGRNSKRKNLEIAPDINSYLYRLPLEYRQTFIEGVGFVLVGSIIHSIEKGIWYGWDDNNYISILNNILLGTPIPQETQEGIQKRTNYQPINSDAETKKITKIAIRDKTFAEFFRDPGNLPRLVSAHLLNLSPVIQESVLYSAQIFSQVVKRLNSQNRPTI